MLLLQVEEHRIPTFEQRFLVDMSIKVLGGTERTDAMPQPHRPLPAWK